MSDREYVLRILDAMEGKPNSRKAGKIATLLGGRIRERLMNYGKIPRDPVAALGEPRPPTTPMTPEEFSEIHSETASLSRTEYSSWIA